mmetsp:Transcript_9387/g.13084  ORF Transcript_9387/g.13084 Transcript_9387/m.13084 type:complete len:248 (-) Transcript_9387:225-968(-)|eukprot:CAMPEP_0184485236 /NCGR_PEP_ID=MMETSP0113_2-20130426/6868_1 /TAXON_ID=91329 /ORGANISM="Norrisiella sphaerica, Strain BC52" /LENGTH=247 /DNA_ID=CAMNT_0026866601 /DNA_START=43 /DNA_END=786 /DNA_ORIENTATION=-
MGSLSYYRASIAINVGLLLAVIVAFVHFGSTNPSVDADLQAGLVTTGNSRSVSVNAERFRLNNLSPQPGATHRKKRVGRGYSAGQGGSCGRGMRGQNSRSGGGVRSGFEGGQMPLYRRLPKYPGRPMGPGHQYTRYGVVKLEHLNQMPDNSVVDFPALREARVMTDTKENIHKVLGVGELTAKGLTVRAHAVSDTARKAIEENGGSVEILPKRKHYSYETNTEKKPLHPRNKKNLEAKGKLGKSKRR